MRIGWVFITVTIVQRMLNFVHQLDEPNHEAPSLVVDVQYVVDERGPNDGLSDDQYDALRGVVDNEQLRS